MLMKAPAWAGGLVALALVAAAPSAAQTPGTPGEAEAHQVFDELDRQWNARDAEAFSAVFAGDASFVFVDRRDTLQGRRAILERFSVQFPTMAPELRHRTTIQDVRAVASGAQMVDGTVEILRQAQPEAGEPVVLLTFAVFGVVVRGTGEWQIQALRVVELPEEGGG